MPYGVLCQWNDAKFFGFIQPNEPGPPILCHVSAFRHGDNESVQAGDGVTYGVEFDWHHGSFAIDVQRTAPAIADGRRRDVHRRSGRGRDELGPGAVCTGIWVCSEPGLLVPFCYIVQSAHVVWWGDDRGVARVPFFDREIAVEIPVERMRSLAEARHWKESKAAELREALRDLSEQDINGPRRWV